MPIDVVEPTIGSSDTSFLTPQDVFGLKPIATQFTDFLSSIPKSLSDFVSSKSTVTDTSTQTSRTNLPLRTIAASAGAVGTGVTIYATATNPDLNKTLQTNANALSSVGEALANTSKAGLGFTNFLTGSPYGPVILIGGLALLALVILKK